MSTPPDVHVNVRSTTTPDRQCYSHRYLAFAILNNGVCSCNRQTCLDSGDCQASHGEEKKQFKKVAKEKVKKY